MAYASVTMRKIENGADIVFKNEKYITLVTLELPLERKKIKSMYLKVIK